MKQNTSRQEYLWVFLVLLVCVALSVRLLFFIKSRAVNLLFSDHWTYLTPLFKSEGAWQRFVYQHGPHRQGVGFVISGWILETSNWNTTYDSLFMGVVLIFAALFSLLLLKKYRGRILPLDIFVLLLILSPLHYETILLAPNSSHSIVPFFLIIISGFSLIGSRSNRSLIGGLFLGALLLFSGFGFFAGITLLSILILNTMCTANNNKFIRGLTILFAIFAITLFFKDYSFSSGVSDFSLRPPTAFVYFEFLAYFWAGVFQIRKPLALPFGAAMLLAIISVLICSFYRLRRCSDNSYQLPIYFILSSLLYSVALSVGRIETGVEFAQGSRYMILAIPAIFGVYLFLQSLPKTKLHSLASCLMFLLSCRNIHLDTTHSQVLNGFQEIKRRWLAEYQPDLSVKEIEDRAGVLLLGASEEHFRWLKQKKLHFPLKDTIFQR